MIKPFIERLEEGVMLCDGGMGTMIYSRGVPFDYCFDELNISNPSLIQGIHLEYIKAGADIIETNTFGANRFKLRNHGFENKVRDINLKGVKNAREARETTGAPIFIAGSIGPLGKPLAPYGVISNAEALSAFKEQAEALLEGGVDLFICETFSDINEIRIAVKAIKEICDLPIIASITYDMDGNTVFDNTPAEVTFALNNLRVDVIGTNCTIGPQGVFDVIQKMSEVTKRRLIAQPNAGLPTLKDGRLIYLTSPDYIAHYAKLMIEAGVSIVGGCCGTTPEHIKAIRKIIDSLKPSKIGNEKIEKQKDENIKLQDYPTIRLQDQQTIKLQDQQPNHLTTNEFARRLLNKEFVISVEIDPPKGFNPTKMLEGARMLKERGVHSVNIADSPMAKVRMSALSSAYLIKEKIGIEPILHFTCRDRNLMGIQADLIGAHALGIVNILALTGDPTAIGDYPNATTVKDTDSIGLVNILKKFNEGYDLAGKQLGNPANFFIGVAVNFDEEKIDTEIDRLKRKISAGAQFIMSQPVYELRTLENFFEKFGGKPSIPFLLGILPLQNYKHTEFLHNEVPGISIPNDIQERMRLAGKEGIKEGIKIACEIISKVKNLVDGIYLMPSFGRYEVVAEIAETILNKTL